MISNVLVTSIQARSILGAVAPSQASVLQAEKSETQEDSRQKPSNPVASQSAATESTASTPLKSQDESQLSDEEMQAVIKQLKQRDQEVRAHEAAHLSAAGGLARGGMQFSFQAGPDGHRYAIGGEVNIEVSPGRTPEETLQKAQKIQQAALAPAEPSSQDYSVARAASQMAMQAQSELASSSTKMSGAGQEEGKEGRNRGEDSKNEMSRPKDKDIGRVQKVSVVQQGLQQRDLFVQRLNMANLANLLR